MLDINQRVKTSLTRKWLESVVMAFTKEAGLNYPELSVSLVLVGQAQMKKINYLYRHQDKVTDVLSFAEEKDDFVVADLEEQFLGEIIICVPQAKKQAQALGHTFKAEVLRLLVHGLAHLIGYDHEGVSPRQADKMFNFERQVMKRLGQNMD